MLFSTSFTMINLVEIEMFAVIAVNVGVFGLIVYSFRNFVYGLINLRDDLVTDIKGNPDKYASFVIPVIDRIVRKEIGDLSGQGAASQGIKPIKITGNRGLDGLITMFISSKLMQPQGGASGSPDNGSNQEKAPDNPFMR